MRAFAVALIGADGAGKSAVAGRLTSSLPMPAIAVYMGENPEAGGAVLPTTRWLWRRRAAAGAGPVHGAPPPPGSRQRRGLAVRLLGAPRTALLLLNQLAEEWWRWRSVQREVRQGRIVVLDRSWLHDYWFYDVVGDHRSPVQKVHGWWLRRVLGRPEMTICLDAPAEALHARKARGQPRQPPEAEGRVPTARPSHARLPRRRRLRTPGRGRRRGAGTHRRARRHRALVTSLAVPRKGRRCPAR